MTTMNDFTLVDDFHDVMAAHVLALRENSFRSEYKNIETLAATRTLLDVDTPIQRFDCNGSNRIVKAPTANAVENHMYHIINASDNSETLTIQNNAGTVDLIVLHQGWSALLLPDGNGGYTAMDVMGGSWKPVTFTWTRTGDHQFTVPGDLTSLFTKSKKVRYKDGGASYDFGMVRSSSYSFPNTTVNLMPNTDFAMAASTITDTYVSDMNMPDGFPAVFNFAAAWTSDGTQPVLGNGTLVGTWTPIARSIKVDHELQLGSTSTIGSSTYRLSLPCAPLATYRIGNCTVLDVSAGGAGYYPGIAQASGTTAIFIVNGGIIQATSPFIFDAGDIIWSSTIIEY